MAHAETCPLCNGSGKLQEPGSTAVMNKTCHGCGGKGWVSVEDRQDFGDPCLVPYPWMSSPPQWWTGSTYARHNLGSAYLQYNGFNSKTAV